MVKEAGIDVIKLDGASRFSRGCDSANPCGNSCVGPSLGSPPQTALKYGMDYSAVSKPGVEVPSAMCEHLINEAKMLEEAGAVMLNFYQFRADCRRGSDRCSFHTCNWWPRWRSVAGRPCKTCEYGYRVWRQIPRRGIVTPMQIYHALYWRHSRR